MNWELESLPPSERARMSSVGRQFSSSAARKQAVQTLQALDEHQEVVAVYGYGKGETAALKKLAHQSAESTLLKSNVQASGRVTGSELRGSVRGAKKAKRRATSVFHVGAAKLRLEGTPEALEAAKEVETRLQQVTPTAFDVDLLKSQMEILINLYNMPVVAQATAAMGGPESKAVLEAALADLAAKEAAHAKGIPLHGEQEMVDIIDGMIVTLCRLARKAARAAAADLEQPALAKPFELSALYP